jgi:hypothetical protein
MHLNSFKFSYVFQVYTHNPIENLRRIERVGKVAIIKQLIDSMCISEALLEKNAKIEGRKPYAARC